MAQSPGSGKGQASTVVSPFFAKKTAQSKPPPGPGDGGPGGKKPSIIELSDSTTSSDDDGGEDSELQVLGESSSSATMRKRKVSPTSTLSSSKPQTNRAEGSSSAADAGGPTTKKMKVAPLFAKAKAAQQSISVKQESDANGGAESSSIKQLSQWKYAPPSPSNAINAAQSSGAGAVTASTMKDSAALERRRAEVRRRLLGLDTAAARRRAASGGQDEGAADADDDAMDEDDGSDLSAQASTSNSKASTRKEGSSSSSRFDRFASGAAKPDQAKSSSSAQGKTRSVKGKQKDEGPKYTPLEQQVLDIKAKHPDTLLIVEVGYKFKFFGEDARIAAKELNVACFMSQHFYTAMIPVHRLQVHIKRLISRGYKVGVVRQKETAALKKAGDNRSAPFTRELTDLYTASTYVEGLDEDTVTGAPPTYGTLLCICEESLGGKGSDEKVAIGLVAAQPTTGEVTYDYFNDGFLRNELETRLLHLQPGEVVLMGKTSGPTNKVVSYLMQQDAAASGLTHNRIVKMAENLSYNSALSLLTDFYKKTRTRDPAHIQRTRSKSDKQGMTSKATPTNGPIDLTLLSSQEAVSSPEEESDAPADTSNDGAKGDSQGIGVILRLPEKVAICLAGLHKHLSAFRLDSVFQRPKYFVPFAERGSMLLNANTMANLEIFRNQTDYKATGSLFSLLDHTKTPFGQRLLRHWVAKPLLQLDVLQERIDAIDEATSSSSYLLGKLRGLLKGLPDLERGLARIHYGRASPQELVRILMAFQRIGDEFPNLPTNLESSSYGFKSPMINEALYALPRVKPVVQRFIDQVSLAKAREGKKEDFFVFQYEPEAITDCKDVLLAVEAEFQQHLLECRKILRKPSAEYVSVALDEYLLEVRISESKSVPADWIRINGTKTVYRYRSPRMQTLLEERDQAAERLAAEAEVAFQAFLRSISSEYESFRDVVVKLATVDCLLSLATVGSFPGYVKAVFVDRPTLQIKGGRHPIVEQITEMPFIPNDAVFDQDDLRAMVITGCNMSGKSSYSRMVALLVIMAQIGCRLPCDSAEMGLCDYVGTRFGASDELARGRSTFMVELTETCEIIKAATPRSLIVLDELGRGTSTKDGLAIAFAVLEYVLKRCNCATLFITHFPQLAEVATRYPRQCQLFQMSYIEEEGRSGVPDITFLYKLV